MLTAIGADSHAVHPQHLGSVFVHARLARLDGRHQIRELGSRIILVIRVVAQTDLLITIFNILLFC